jgi:hypothetical protein
MEGTKRCATTPDRSAPPFEDEMLSGAAATSSGSKPPTVAHVEKGSLERSFERCHRRLCRLGSGGGGMLAGRMDHVETRLTERDGKGARRTLARTVRRKAAKAPRNAKPGNRLQKTALNGETPERRVAFHNRPASAIFLILFALLRAFASLRRK